MWNFLKVTYFWHNIQCRIPRLTRYILKCFFIKFEPMGMKNSTYQFWWWTWIKNENRYLSFPNVICCHKCVFSPTFMESDVMPGQGVNTYVLQLFFCRFVKLFTKYTFFWMLPLFSWFPNSRNVTFPLHQHMELQIDTSFKSSNFGRVMLILGEHGDAVPVCFGWFDGKLSAHLNVEIYEKQPLLWQIVLY